MAYEYAIELFFDEISDTKIRHSWARIAEKAGLPNKMAEAAGSRPHISVGVFGIAKLEALLNALKNLSQEQSIFEIRLDSLGIFPKPGVLFFGPAANRQLLEFHQRCFEKTFDFVDDWEDYYRPERIIFHCTINLGLDADELLKAVSVGLETSFPMVVKAVGLGLVKLPEGDFIGSFPLKE